MSKNNLYKHSDFIDRVYELLPECRNIKESYYKVEDEHYTMYGEFKYKSYNSFRTIKCNKMKEERVKKIN